MKRREDRVTEGLPALVNAEATDDFCNLPKQIRSMKMLGAQLASHVPVLDLEFLMGEYTLFTTFIPTRCSTARIPAA